MKRIKGTFALLLVILLLVSTCLAGLAAEAGAETTAGQTSVSRAAVDQAVNA